MVICRVIMDIAGHRISRNNEYRDVIAVFNFTSFEELGDM